MIRDEFYTEHPDHKEIPLIADLYEAGHVMLIGFCFMMVFVLIMTLILNREID